MDLAAGILKLERIIRAKKALVKKLEITPDDQVIKDTLKQHKETIAYLKNALDFDNRFEVPKACTCDIKLGNDKIKVKDASNEVVGVAEIPRPATKKRNGRKKKNEK
jgi:hypothetical protein